MNRSLMAAMAICLTTGMVGLAQAQTSPSTTPSPAMGGTAPVLSNPSAPAATANPGQAAQVQPTSADIEQAQQQLKAQGLYRGAIDGDLGPETKTALSQFQKRSGLPETASLDQQTRERLMGNATTGSGSTTAPTSTDQSSSPGSATMAPGSSNMSPGSATTTAPGRHN